MQLLYKELFDYNHQVNQNLILAFNEHSDQVSENSVRWLNHILNAHQVWISRMDQLEEPLSPWHVHSPGILKEMDSSNFIRTCDFLKTGELERTVEYVNSMGRSYKNSVKDILFHIINHSTYHRGQIASDFRQNGLKPLVTDYIAFKR